MDEIPQIQEKRVNKKAGWKGCERTSFCAFTHLSKANTIWVHDERSNFRHRKWKKVMYKYVQDASFSWLIYYSIKMKRHIIHCNRILQYEWYKTCTMAISIFIYIH